MRSDKSPTGAGMTTRQKLTIGILVIVILLVLWQVVGMFGGGDSTPAKPAATANARQMSSSTPSTNSPSSGVQQQGQMQVGPEPSKLLTPAPEANSPEAVAAMAQQKELEAKYVDALNQLQMLRIQRDIAQTNQQIMAAKLATITAQRNIITIAAPPPEPVAPPVNYTKVMGGATPGATGSSSGAQGSTSTDVAKESPYRVISVSQIQYKWSAVIGYQGNLLHVQVGDILPGDNATVVSINRSAVVVSKDGVRRKLSLVPII